MARKYYSKNRIPSASPPKLRRSPRGRKRSEPAPLWDLDAALALVPYRLKFVTRAKYASLYRNDPELLAFLESSANYLAAETVKVWAKIAGNYPASNLTEGDKDREYLSSRAYVLKFAITHLLELLNAPKSMCADLDFILSKHISKGAWKLEKIQALIIDNIGLLPEEIAERAGVPVSTVQTAITKKQVIWPRICD